MHSARRINVLFIMMQMEMGGSERLVYNLVRSVDRARFNPSIAWFHGSRILPEFRDLQVPLFHIPKRKRADFSAMRALSAIIRENNIDIVNAHHFMPFVYSVYGSKIGNRAKLVYTEHSEWEIEQLPWKWRAAGGWLLRRGDGAVGVSRAVAERIRKTFKTDPRKTAAILNGVRQEARPDDGKRESLRKELGIVSHDPVIGIVANLKKVKNHLFLLQAFRELVQDRKNAMLLLVGGSFENDPDNTEPEIRRFIAVSGLANRVILAGYRPDVPDLLGLMDVFCLTSLQEGLPISLIEAMAAGIPVVGTDSDGIREVISHGKNGFLVKTGDVQGFKKILTTLLGDASLRRRLGAESKRLAQESYSLARCVRQYEDLYASLAEAV